MQSATVAENLRKSPLPGEVNGTAVPYLTVYRHTGKEAAIPDGASRYLYYIVDGSVRLHTPSGILDYVSGQYSLSAVDMPFRGEIAAPSVHGDFLALSFGFTADEVFGVLMSIEGNLAERIADGKLPRAFSERADGNVTDCIARLTALLDDGQSLQFMAGHLKREIIFNVLCGSCGSRLLQSIIGTNGGGIYDVNEWIKRNFKENFTVEDEARQNNMSVSALHQKFKGASGMGLLQWSRTAPLPSTSFPYTKNLSGGEIYPSIDGSADVCYNFQNPTKTFAR